MGIIILIQRLSIPAVEDSLFFAFLLFFILLTLISMTIYILNT